MVTRTIKGLGIRYYLWGEEPVQALGDVCGGEFYFRAANGEWEIKVTDMYGDTVAICSGKRSDAGPMPHSEAISLIELHIREYVAAND